jgi:hypothetical protein
MERRVSKSCCGKSAIIIVTTKPIRKNHLDLFRSKGFVIPENYVKAGMFYCKKDGFVASATFGICNINIRCNGSLCQQRVDEFEAIIRQIEGETV